MSGRNSQESKANRRAERERRRESHRGQVAVVGCTSKDDPDEIEEVKTSTHDTLNRLTGSFRRGPIGWHITHPPDAREALDRFLEAMPSFAGQGYEEWMDEHPDAVLIIAMAESVDPRIRNARRGQ